MRRTNYNICETSYDETDWDGTFLKNRFERSITDSTKTFEFLLSISSTIWLTAVEHLFPNMRNFWDFLKICQIVSILVFRSRFFRFLPKKSEIASNVMKKAFPTFWYKAYSVKMIFMSLSEYKKLTRSEIWFRKYFFELWLDWL